MSDAKEFYRYEAWCDQAHKDITSAHEHIIHCLDHDNYVEARTWVTSIRTSIKHIEYTRKKMDALNVEVTTDGVRDIEPVAS